MAIALGLDPAWTTGTATTIVSAAFSPVANSLIIVASQIDATSAPTISDSVGLTWTAIGTAQAASAGGRAMAWWAYTATARTNMTVSVNWSSGATKSIKVVTWTGTASASAVISKAQNTSTATPLNIGVTTTNDGCRIAGTALDWNARGGPTSSDDEVSYTVTNAISGTTAHKATNSSGVGTSVTLNIVKGTVNPSAADWAYKVYEIVPAVGGASSVTLTPATVTSSAVAVTPIPQPVALVLTPITVTSSAVTVTPISQPVTLTLTPAVMTSTALPVTVTPVAVNVTLTPVVTTLSAPPVDVVVPGTPWVRNATQSGTGAGTSLTHSVAIPTCQVGDDLWASFTVNSGHGVVTDPAGWTRVFPTTVADDSFMSLLVYRKTATATEVAGGNVTVTVGTAVRGNAGAVSIANADTGALGGSVSAVGVGTATTSTSFNPTVPNTLVLSILALDSGTEVATSPALTTERWNPTRTVTGQANAGATAAKADTTLTPWNWSWSTSLAYKTWVGAIQSTSTTSSVTLTPAVMTTTAPAVTATPQPGAVTLTQVTRTITAVAVTATPQPVTITLSPAVITTAAVVLSIGGVGGTTLTPAILTTTASSVTTTPGVVTKTLTSAGTTIAAIPLSVTPLAVTITLTPAVMTVTALGVGLGAIGAATLTPAQLTTSARALTAIPVPMSVTLTTATITFAVPTVIVTPGAININIAVAQATILLNPVSFSAIPTSAVTLTPAQLALSTLSGVYVTKPGVDLMTIAFATVTGVGEYVRGELADSEGGVPERFALIVPGQIAWDNCDCGQFAQTINSVASSRVFPTPASDAPTEPCGHPLAVVSVTVSLMRCIPGLDQSGNSPSVRSLLSAARVLEEDRQILRRSVGTHLKSLHDAYRILNYTVGVANSAGPEGQCGGVELTYTFGIVNDATVC